MYISFKDLVFIALCLLGIVLLSSCTPPTPPAPKPPAVKPVLADGQWSDYAMDKLLVCQMLALSVSEDVETYTFSVDSCLLREGVSI